MDLERLEKVDKLKTKILKYIFYKKRTEKEILEKFKNEDSDILDETIENLKELGYINDEKYVERFMHEAIALKNLSIFELKYKLYSKGVNKNLIEEYIENNKEELEEYERNNVEKIVIRKSNTAEIEKIRNFLKSKGYKEDNIRNALNGGE